MAHTKSSPHEPDEQFASTVEADHVNIRAVAGFAIGLAVVAAIAHFAMLGMFWMMDRQNAADQPARVFPIAADQDTRRPPEPRLQGGVDTDNAGRLLPGGEEADHNAGPKEALRQLHAEEDTILDGYSWVDRNSQVVHIPIDAAMKLTLQRGLPARPAGANAQQTPSTPTSSTPSGQEKGK
jgi:hypothetical protein